MVLNAMLRLKTLDAVYFSYLYKLKTEKE